MAIVGAASIRGVPPFGLPKMRSLVGCISIPTFFASPLWSMSAKTATSFALRIAWSFARVSSTECLLDLLTIPLLATSSPSAVRCWLQDKSLSK